MKKIIMVLVLCVSNAYAAYNSSSVAKLLTPEQMGAPDFGEAIKHGLEGSRDVADTAYLHRQLAESLLRQQLQNKMRQ